MTIKSGFFFQLFAVSCRIQITSDTQVGEFYETMGTDAVMLVQHAGLNPMGQGDPPRAGCPIGNLRRTVADLVEQAGLSVVRSAITCFS